MLNMPKCFSFTDLCWSSTTPFPGWPVTLRPRTAALACPSILWCSIKCTTSSWPCCNTYRAELRAGPYQGTKRGEWREGGSKHNPIDNYSAGLYMYVSYNGDDLGRQSLHPRPSTVEENQTSGVHNTHSKRKRGYERRPWMSFQRCGGQRKTKTKVLIGGVLHPWFHATSTVERGSSVIMDSASCIINVWRSNLYRIWWKETLMLYEMREWILGFKTSNSLFLLDGIISKWNACICLIYCKFLNV